MGEARWLAWLQAVRSAACNCRRARWPACRYRGSRAGGRASKGVMTSPSAPAKLATEALEATALSEARCSMDGET